MNWSKDRDAEIQRLRAEIGNREGEKQEMREVIDRLKAEVKSLEATRESYDLMLCSVEAELKQELERNAGLVEALKQIAYDAGSWDQLRDKYQWQYCNIAKQALQSAAKE
jgi:archaellum component FlaC